MSILTATLSNLSSDRPPSRLSHPGSLPVGLLQLLPVVCEPTASEAGLSPEGEPRPAPGILRLPMLLKAPFSLSAVSLFFFSQLSRHRGKNAAGFSNVGTSAESTTRCRAASCFTQTWRVTLANPNPEKRTVLVLEGQ